jgi:hypothetical protein
VGAGSLRHSDTTGPASLIGLLMMSDVQGQISMDQTESGIKVKRDRSALHAGLACVNYVSATPMAFANFRLLIS